MILVPLCYNVSESLSLLNFVRHFGDATAIKSHLNILGKDISNSHEVIISVVPTLHRLLAYSFRISNTQSQHNWF